MQARILIADDHELLRRGVRFLLETQPGWHVCGEAVHGAEAVEKTRQLRPDLIVLDLTMPVLNGLDAARQIVKECPKTAVLIFTQHESAEVLQEILTTGAQGYVPKSNAAHELIGAVEALLLGRTFYPSKFAKKTGVSPGGVSVS